MTKAPDSKARPVIFLAFANEQDDQVRYLRNLPDEARQLREILSQAERDGLCELVERSNASAEDIFKVFQDPQYRDRVAVFHYGGHANGYQLLLESADGQTLAADAGGLAAFFGQQRGLELVFLNGCSTQDQAQGLLDANVSAVIATGRSIDDAVATAFAGHFYRGLAGGASVRTAYKEAEAAIQTAKGGKTRDAYSSDEDESEGRLAADRWPWSLYLREGADSADQWNLPKAVDDPLFGLPPLPEQDLPETPYRHLNWFTRNDAEVFFGRGHQIRELYDRLTAPRTAPILLFYGQSGVGKSSVLDAGLIPRLEQDYAVRYLRRSADGLLATLQRAFGEVSDPFIPEVASEPKEGQLGKPVIAVIDQLQKHYSSPSGDTQAGESARVLRAMKAIFSDTSRYLSDTANELLETLNQMPVPDQAPAPAAASGSIGAAWRNEEEQLGKPLIVFLDQVEELYTHPSAAIPDELDQFLQVLQTTFNDPDRRPRGKLVLGFRKEWLAELESYLIHYALPRTKVFLEPLDRRGVIEVVRGPAQSARLRERYGLTVQDGLPEIIADDLLEDQDSAIAPTLQILLTKLWSKATEVDYEHPLFTQALYQDLKRDGILLRDFLDQQIAAFRRKYPDAVDSGLLIDILAMHTTALGTAGQCSLEQLRQQYAHLGARLPDLLQQCQDLHLLTVAAGKQKDSSKTTRLAHDTLAPLIRKRFEESDLPGQRARRILDNRSVDWAGDQIGTPLDAADLIVVEQGANGTRALSSTEERLLAASRELRARRQGNLQRLKIAGIAAAGAIIALGAFGWWQADKASRNANVALAAAAEAEAAAAEAEAQREGANRSLNQLLDRLQVQLESLNGELAVSALDDLSRVLGDREALSRVRAELFQSTEWFANVSFALEQLADREAQRASWAQDVRKELLARFRDGSPTAADDEALNKRILISGGSFQMGSPATTDPEVYENERPQHRVTLSPFLIQEHEVTNREYRRFDPNHNDRADDLPVVNVSWHEAMAYAAWLGGNLPTEAQWEFAARGADGRKYPWGGDDPSCDRANYYACVPRILRPVGRQDGKTSEGVYDLSGNVWEWCRDWYGPYPDREERDPLGPSTGSARIVRGGSFNINVYALRSAYRFFYTPLDRTMNMGFRVVWDSAEELQ